MGQTAAAAAAAEHPRGSSWVSMVCWTRGAGTAAAVGLPFPSSASTMNSSEIAAVPEGAMVRHQQPWPPTVEAAKGASASVTAVAAPPEGFRVAWELQLLREGFRVAWELQLLPEGFRVGFSVVWSQRRRNW